MIKLVETLIGSAEGQGSRRVQLVGLGILGVLSFPDFAWPLTALVVTGVAALTVTDVLKKD